MRVKVNAKETGTDEDLPDGVGLLRVAVGAIKRADSIKP
jgi:hypothetical protein